MDVSGGTFPLVPFPSAGPSLSSKGPRGGLGLRGDRRETGPSESPTLVGTGRRVL